MKLDELLKRATGRPWSSEVEAGPCLELLPRDDAALVARAVNTIEQARDALQAAEDYVDLHEGAEAREIRKRLTTALAVIDGRAGGKGQS